MTTLSGPQFFGPPQPARFVVQLRPGFVRLNRPSAAPARISLVIRTGSNPADPPAPPSPGCAAPSMAAERHKPPRSSERLRPD